MADYWDEIGNQIEGHAEIALPSREKSLPESAFVNQSRLFDRLSARA
jgi:hypothetical protein